MPSRVRCLVATTLGSDGEKLSHANVPPTIRIEAATAHDHLDLRIEAGCTASIFPEVVSRIKRFRSARTSAALWYRTSRSFSKALLIMRSNSAGTSGLRRTAGVGVESR